MYTDMDKSIDSGYKNSGTKNMIYHRCHLDARFILGSLCTYHRSIMSVTLFENTPIPMLINGFSFVWNL